jgi:hypothetical protein
LGDVKLNYVSLFACHNAALRHAVVISHKSLELWWWCTKGGTAASRGLQMSKGVSYMCLYVHMFVYVVFNDVLCGSDCVVWNNRACSVNRGQLKAHAIIYALSNVEGIFDIFLVGVVCT